MTGMIIVLWAAVALTAADDISNIGRFYSTDSIEDWTSVLGKAARGGLHYHHGFFNVNESNMNDDIFNEAMDNAVSSLYDVVGTSTRVLDVGSGWCGPLSMLEDLNNNTVIGVTVSEAQHTHCTSLNRTVVLGDITSNATINSLNPFGKFDTALFLESFSHIRKESRTMTLSNIADIADRLVMRVNTRGAGVNNASVFGGTMDLPTETELRRNLEDAGWVIKSLVNVRHRTSLTQIGYQSRLRRFNHRVSNAASQIYVLNQSVLKEQLGRTSDWQASHPLIDIVAVSRFSVQCMSPVPEFTKMKAKSDCDLHLRTAATKLFEILSNVTQTDILPGIRPRAIVMSTSAIRPEPILTFHGLFQCVVDQLLTVVESTRATSDTKISGESMSEDSCPSSQYWLSTLLRPSSKAYIHNNQTAIWNPNRYTVGIPVIVGSTMTRHRIVEHCLVTSLLAPSKVVNQLDKVSAASAVEIGVEWSVLNSAHDLHASIIQPTGRVYFGLDDTGSTSQISSFEWPIGSNNDPIVRNYEQIELTRCGKAVESIHTSSNYISDLSLLNIGDCWVSKREALKMTKIDMRLQSNIKVSDFYHETGIVVPAMVAGLDSEGNFDDGLYVSVVSMSSTGYAVYYKFGSASSILMQNSKLVMTSSPTSFTSFTTQQMFESFKPSSLPTPRHSIEKLEPLFGSVKTVEEFFDHVYGVEYRHYKASPSSPFAGTTKIDLVTLLEDAMVRQQGGGNTVHFKIDGKHVPRSIINPAEASIAARIMNHIFGTNVTDGAQKEFPEAMSIVIKDLEKDDSLPAKLTLLQKALMESTGLSVGMNAYISPQSSVALKPHTDPYDVFILQTQGTKRWNICNPVKKAINGISLSDAYAAQLLELEDATPFGCVTNENAATDSRLHCETLDMYPGDILYLPKSIVHSAAVLEPHVSVHITIALIRKHTTWRELFILACNQLSDLEKEKCVDAIVSLSSSVPTGILWHQPYPSNVLSQAYKESSGSHVVFSRCEKLKNDVQVALKGRVSFSCSDIADLAISKSISGRSSDPLVSNETYQAHQRHRRQSCNRGQSVVCPSGYGRTTLVLGGSGSSCDGSCDSSCDSSCDYYGDCNGGCNGDCNDDCDAFSSCTYDCAPCTNCPSGRFLSGCSPNHLGTCATCAICTIGQQYVSSICGGQSDTVCTTCSNLTCTGDYYRQGICEGSTNGYYCNSCSNSVCGSNTYRTGNCGAASNPTENGFQCATCSNIQCGYNQYRSGSCSGTNNGYTCASCNSCPLGTFKSGGCTDGIGDNQCTNWRTCDSVTEFQTLAPTNTSDRECAQLTVCDVTTNQYISVNATLTSDRVCSTTGNCSYPAQYELRPPTILLDRECASVSPNCTDFYDYEVSAPTQTSDRVCETCTNVICSNNKYRDGGLCNNVNRGYTCLQCANASCGPGLVRIGRCGDLRGSYNDGFYSSTENGFECISCSNQVCGSGQYQDGECPGTGGNINGFTCRNCSNLICGLDEYQSGTCSGRTNNFTCTQCSNTSCELRYPNHFRTGTCTSENGGYTCQPCGNSTCGSGLYRTGTCDSETQTYTCEPLRASCPPGQYVFRPSTLTSNLECAPCQEGTWRFRTGTECIPQSFCLEGQYAESQPTPSSDTVCVRCPSGSFQPQTGLRESQCIPWSSCDAGSYISQEGNTTTDRNCGLCQPCWRCNSTPIDDELEILQRMRNQICIGDNEACNQTYSSTPNTQACLPVQVDDCHAGENYTAASLTSDRLCTSTGSEDSDSDSSSLDFIIIIAISIFIPVIIFIIAIIRFRKARKRSRLSPNNRVTSSPLSTTSEFIYHQVEVDQNTFVYEIPMLHNPAYEIRPSVHTTTMNAVIDNLNSHDRPNYTYDEINESILDQQLDVNGYVLDRDSMTESNGGYDSFNDVLSGVQANLENASDANGYLVVQAQTISNDKGVYTDIEAMRLQDAAAEIKKGAYNEAVYMQVDGHLIQQAQTLRLQDDATIYSKV